VKQYKRSTRIGEQILRELSSLFVREYTGKAPGMVTFTHVKVSDDLRYATAYFSCLGSAEDQQRVTEYLEVEKKKIRQMVGRSLQLRFVPEFTFKFDHSIEEGIRIEQLLNEIKSDHKEQ
jgi:ribosome-binding factor A